MEICAAKYKSVDRRWIKTKTKPKKKRGGKNGYFFIFQDLEMFPTSIQYLRIVSNIVTQADEAGFKFFRAKSAGVVLVMQCIR